MEEKSLINECLKGNHLAQRTFFEKFSPKMMTVALRYMKDRERAEDVLQDAFIKVFTHLNRFSFDGSLEGWIRRIVVNTALDQIRKDAKLMANDSMDDVEYKVQFDAHTLDSLEAEHLMELVRGMPDGYRTVFNLFAIEGYSHKEIGEMLGVSENTSKTQYMRARAYMRDKIESLYGEGSVSRVVGG